MTERRLAQDNSRYSIEHVDPTLPPVPTVSVIENDAGMEDEFSLRDFLTILRRRKPFCCKPFFWSLLSVPL